MASLTNILRCLDYKLIPVEYCEGCKIHKGVYETYQSIKKTILETVLALKSSAPTAQIIVTGHSMGGAIAAMVALDLLKYVG